MINEASGKPNDYFIESFELAKVTENAYVIMEGDWGGQIYLICPMKLIQCSEFTLTNLLDDLDNTAWECNEGEGKGIYYEIRIPGEIVGGGMGGGEVTDQLWLHKEFTDLGLFKAIEKVITGKTEKIK